MKKFAIILLILFGGLLNAQNTTVSATVVDSDGTAWAGGTWSINFLPNPAFPGVSQYKLINGVNLSPSVYSQNGSLNGSGTFSVVVYDSSLISPAGSGWTLSVCPNASSACGIYTFKTAGSSMNITANLTTTIAAPRFNAVAGSYGYIDAEAQITLPTGATYFNVTSQCQRVYQSGAWICPSTNGTISGLTPAFLPLATGATVISKSSPLSVDDINTPTKVTSNVSLAAPSVNGILSVATSAIPDLRTYSNVVINTASQLLTSSNAAFIPADIGKLITVPMGTQGIATITYSSGATVTGVAGNNAQTCDVTGFDGGGTGAEAIVALTGTNTLAASTPLVMINYGTGYSSFPTSATLSNGSATCSGTITLTGGSYFYWPVTTTITGFTSSTQVTIANPATSTVNGTFSYGAWIGTDNTPLIQGVVNTSHSNKACVLIPPGNYGLSSPINITGGECIQGTNGFLSSPSNTAIYPASGSAAFATPNPAISGFNVYQNAKIQDLYIVGGQNGFDMQESHFITIDRVTCQDQTGYCFSHIIGERHRIEDIQCFHFNVTGQGCLSTGSWANSIYASAYKNGVVQHIFNAGVLSNVASIQTTPGSPAFPAVGQTIVVSGLTTHAYLNGTWTVINASNTVIQFTFVHADDPIVADSGTAVTDWADIWFDKAVIERITDQGADSYTIFSDGNRKAPGSFSGARANYIKAIGAPRNTASKAFIRTYGIQNSNFSDLGMDNIKCVSAACFDVTGIFYYSRIENYVASSPGNSYANALYFHGDIQESTVADSLLDGDNVTFTGVHITGSPSSNGLIVSTRGSVISDAANVLQRNNISFNGGSITATNMLGSNVITDHNNLGAAVVLNADITGSVADTASFQVIHGTGSGGQKTTFSVNPRGPQAGTGVFNFTPIASNAGAVNGDCWTQTTGLFCQINGSTVGPIPCTGGCSFTGTTAMGAATLSSTLGLSSSSVLGWNSFDTGISRYGLRGLAFGNGTLGDATGEIKLAKINFLNSGFIGIQQPTTLTATRTFTWPDISGTVALTGAAVSQTFNGPVVVGQTKFTATGCTSITSTLGNGTAGKFVIGANTCTVVITLNGGTGLTAANGWSCHANDQTTAAGNTGLYFSSSTTTTATLTVPAAAVASDVIDFGCRSY